MKDVTRYKVTCTGCGKSDNVGLLHNTSLIWNDNKWIISGRKRLDGNWGFQCIGCGNDDLMTKQEKKDIKNHQQPDAKDIQKVINNLRPQKPQFLMEPV